MAAPSEIVAVNVPGGAVDFPLLGALPNRVIVAVQGVIAGDKDASTIVFGSSGAATAPISPIMPIKDGGFLLGPAQQPWLKTRRSESLVCSTGPGSGAAVWLICERRRK